jgi:hypothetical protein
MLRDGTPFPESCGDGGHIGSVLESVKWPSCVPAIETPAAGQQRDPSALIKHFHSICRFSRKYRNRNDMIWAYDDQLIWAKVARSILIDWRRKADAIETKFFDSSVTYTISSQL